MFKELKADQYDRARPLFQGQFSHKLSVDAAIEGNNPGHIFVDNIEQPRAALAVTSEATLLVGDDSDPATIEALRQLFKESVLTGEMEFMDESMDLVIYPDTWEAKLPKLIPTHDIEKKTCRHYLCRKVKLDWRAHVPDGYTVHRIDQTWLDNSDFVVTDAIQGWIPLGFGWSTVESFLTKGVCFYVVCGNEAVSRCAATCRAGDQIEVSIITDPEHRERGLATVAVAATVEYCLEHGFNTVGWYSDLDNVGSWKTAEKVGFEKAGEYFYYYYMLDAIDHLAELGWFYFRRREYERSAQYYERAFASREDHPHYYYHIAAAAWAMQGKRERAFKYLHAAVDHGWAWPESTKQSKALRSLHGDPEWEVVLARMEDNVSRDE